MLSANFFDFSISDFIKFLVKMNKYKSSSSLSRIVLRYSGKLKSFSRVKNLLVQVES